MTLAQVHIYNIMYSIIFINKTYVCKKQGLAERHQKQKPPALSVECFPPHLMDFLLKIGAFRVFSDPVIATVGPQFEVPFGWNDIFLVLFSVRSLPLVKPMKTLPKQQRNMTHFTKKEV